MTENEAIRMLRKETSVAYINELRKGASDEEIHQMIQQAMEWGADAIDEIQAYKAIGTVEEFEELLEYRAIGSVDRIKGSIETNYVLLHAYEAIGTVEEFKALKEKSVAKKPEPIDYEKYIDVVKNAKFLRGAYWCPNCKHTVRSGIYCEDCGQKLDWE